MPASLASGTQTAVVGTEHSLATDTAGHTYIFVVDCTNLAMGDTVELRVYTICKPAGTERLAYRRRYKNVQDELVKYSVPIPADVSCRVTLKQTTGTGRNFDWNFLAA